MSAALSSCANWPVIRFASFVSLHAWGGSPLVAADEDAALRVVEADESDVADRSTAVATTPH